MRRARANRKPRPSAEFVEVPVSEYRALLVRLNNQENEIMRLRKALIATPPPIRWTGIACVREAV